MRRATISLLLLVAFAASAQQPKPPAKAPSDAPPALKIIQDSLQKQGEYSYLVKGTVYNPHDKAVKNVVIKYYIWKKYMNCTPLIGQCKRLQTGGLVTANLKYLPPKQSVDFTATQESASCCADQLPNEVPDPLSAEITADWDQ